MGFIVLATGLHNIWAYCVAQYIVSFYGAGYLLPLLMVSVQLFIWSFISACNLKPGYLGDQVVSWELL